MVRIVVLVIVLRLFQRGLEIHVQRNRTFPCLSERVHVKPCVGFHGHVVHLVSEEHIVSCGVPVDEIPQLSFHSGIDKRRVPHRVRCPFQECRIESAVAQDSAPDATVQFGDNRIVRPWLQPQEHPVLQFHHPHGIEGTCGIVIEYAIVELAPRLVSDLILITLAEHGIFTAVSYECGRDVVVSKGVRRISRGYPSGHKHIQGIDHGGVTGCHHAVSVRLVDFPVLHVLDERERNPVLLVEEECVPDDVCRGVVEIDRVFPRIQCGVSDHRVVAGSTVLFADDLVVDVAGVHHVAPAQIVDRCHERLVGRLFALHDAVASETVIFKSEIKFREDVLRRQDVQVVGFFLRVREEGSEIGQLRVRGLCVVHRERLCGICPCLVRIVEGNPVLARPVEPVVVLQCRSGNAQPCGVHVLAVERVVVQPMVVAGVRLADVHLVELPFMGPLDDPLVLQRIRDGESLQNPWSGLPDAVPVRLQAVLHVEDTVGDVFLDLFLYLEIVFFSVRL